MSINPGRATLNIQIRQEHKVQLQQLKNYYRDRINPNMSMTMVVELMIAEKHRKLKISEKANAV